MRKIVSAVDYLHNNRVLHRDLKPENIVYTSYKPDAELKIIDFGLSKMLDEEGSGASTPCGSESYAGAQFGCNSLLC